MGLPAAAIELAQQSATVPIIDRTSQPRIAPGICELAQMRRQKESAQQAGSGLFVVVPSVCDHLLAGLLTLPALGGTFLHMLVVGEFIAFLGAHRTGIDTRFTNEHSEGSAASNDRGGCGTERGTVLASCQCLCVILLATL